VTPNPSFSTTISKSEIPSYENVRQKEKGNKAQTDVVRTGAGEFGRVSIGGEGIAEKRDKVHGRLKSGGSEMHERQGGGVKVQTELENQSGGSDRF